MKYIKINNRFYLAYNGLGNFYLKSNQFEKSEFSYSKAIEINPNKDIYYFSRAVSKVDLKDNQGAIKDYSKAIELNPNISLDKKEEDLLICFSHP